ncbi:hypothetical protein RN001_002643 [Aquatica leii]|uniref:Cilia- and flagella-associated protein 44 n=1 Tax=Aquatica leii TaxID=1421715 RepID=A0AAN7Q8T7_9COLE|nr:hypothetical protein RN001_002643 [Aquatica leii]
MSDTDTDVFNLSLETDEEEFQDEQEEEQPERNPNSEYSHIAVAENGTNPPIIIYEWPTLEIICLLKGGASRCFSHLNYSPDGLLLASQSGEPDFLITIFNWKKSRVVLRTKSNVHEVFRVMFSPDVPGQLTTCGLSHIKFWKMAQTFTGLKLQGELGRFGKSEYCDILGIYPMPDEKVVSGSSWGNMLVWDEGLISVEVCQPQRKTMHTAPIAQFYYDNGDLWSVGMDGYVRVWFYDSIDQADPPDYDRTVEIEPLHTFHVPDCILMSIQKINKKWRDFQFFAQDGNGGLWLIDLNTFAEPKPPVQLYQCHAGAVMDIAACPWGPYLASLGVDGRIQLYNYRKRELLFRHQFPAKGATLIWLSMKMQPSGDELIMGFDDGCVRVVILTIDEKADKYSVQTIQITKPHNKPITRSALNEEESLLVTGGEDSTIFIYELRREKSTYTYLHPIGFIRLPGIVTYLMWHPQLKTTVMAGCLYGHFIQVQVPSVPQNYTTITYILKESPIVQRFITYKAQIRRDIKIAEIEAKKSEKRERKRVEMEKIKADNPGMDIDEEIFLADSEEDEPLEPLHIPDIPNRVLWIQISPDNSIWLSMGGYDAGYIYEYYINQTSEIPSRFLIIYDGDDYPINNFIYSVNKKYLILAMEDGCLRVVKINRNDWRDLSDYWQISMHDNFNGFIPNMCFSYDETYFFTCGYDGNIFSYMYNPLEISTSPKIPTRTVLSKPKIEIEDVDGYTQLSLDEALIKAEEDRINKIANENKNLFLEKIHVLRERFQEMLKRNSKLLPTQVIHRSKLEIDPRISQHLESRLQADLALVKRKLEYSVEKSKVAMEKFKSRFTDPIDIFPIIVTGVEKDVSVAVIRQRKLSPLFNGMLKIIEEKILEAERRMRPPERPPAVKQVMKAVERIKKPLEYFLMGLSPSTIEKGLTPKLTRVLKKYRERKQKIELRREQWLVFNNLKPQKGVNDPEDEVALADAMANIGDFKLKTAVDYKVPPQLRESTVKKYKQLLYTRLRQFTLRHDFNVLVMKLRDEKCQLHEYMSNLKSRLDQIHEELDSLSIKDSPPAPKITAQDFPEKNLNVEVNLPLSTSALKQKEVPISSCGDLLEKEVLLTVKPLTPLIAPSPPPSKGIPSKIIPILNDPEIVSLCEDTDTPWEAEVRDYRLTRYLFEQDQIINKIKIAVQQFDEKVVKLSQKKITVTRDGDLLDLYILTLNQELNILKKFESVEDALQNKVNSRIEETLDMKDVITSLINNIEGHKREIDRLQEEEKSIWQFFFIMVADSKFYDFLRRIFKKKYKPPKVYNPDESSSSSESSESSESEQADAASVDSRDFGIIKLDENVCPKGCDPSLYDRTFELRTKRHGVELSIRDQRASVDALVKEVELKRKKLKGVEMLLKESQRELEAYQREKQKKLNLVECTVVLKLNQLQHLISENQSNKVGDVLVFSKNTLSKLYKRVGQLYNETMIAKSKHKGNITHMTRMKTDCKHMTKKIAQIKTETKELMIIKFGQHVDLEEVEEIGVKTAMFGKAVNLDDMEEAAMRKMVFEFRISEENIGSLYKDEIREWTKKHEEKHGELAETLKLNTAKLDLLGLLNKEKTELARIIDDQSKKREQKQETVEDVIRAYQYDLDKLSKTVIKQREELRILKLEMQRLKTKGLVIEVKPKLQKLPEKEQEKGLLHDDSFYFDYKVPERKPFKLNLDLPTGLFENVSMDVKNMAKKIIMNMIDSISEAALSKFVKEGLVEQLVLDILHRPSVEDVAENLQALLPEEPTDEQQGVIKTAAEKIFSLQQPEASESIVSSSVILNNVIDNNMEAGGSTSQILSNLIFELVSRLPIDFLLNDSSVHTILGKLKNQMQSEDFDKQQLISSILTIRSTRTAEMQMLVDKILETVYETVQCLIKSLYGALIRRKGRLKEFLHSQHVQLLLTGLFIFLVTQKTLN